MKRMPFCNFMLAGVSLSEFGLKIPSPFTSLTISNAQTTSMTSWELVCTVGGDNKRKMNVAAFEALLYTAAQDSYGYDNASGIPVSWVCGWLNDDGSIQDHMSYTGFTLQFSVSVSGQFLVYNIKGYAKLAIQTSMPVLRIPELCGIVQPSAIVEALAVATKANDYYELDIDHNDAPTLVNHGALTTSFNKYVRGDYSGQDDYDTFPGLLRLSKSYNQTRDAGGLQPQYKKLSQVINNATVSPIENFLKMSLTDNTPQCTSFSYWVDEPTLTRPGVIHYKSNAGLANTYRADVLEYGTANTNVLSISGSYNGVAYNMTDMNFASLGFTVDGSGNTIAVGTEVVNSWSSSLTDVFQTANIINDVNAIASQFSGDFTITIPGNTREYEIAQPISLLVMSGNTVSPVTGVYNIISVTHTISSTFVTQLKVQRLTMSTANQVATSQGIYVSGSGYYPGSTFSTTSNVISPYKVNFGILYPDFTCIQTI